MKKSTRSKYWDKLNEILDTGFPKGECKERGEALVLLAYAEMFLLEQEKEFFQERTKWIKQLKEGRICTNCGREKDNDLCDWCVKCVENE